MLLVAAVFGLVVAVIAEKIALLIVWLHDSFPPVYDVRFSHG